VRKIKRKTLALATKWFCLMAKAKAFGVNHATDLKVGAIEYHVVRKVS
jgi:hypothetical protein